MPTLDKFKLFHELHYAPHDRQIEAHQAIDINDIVLINAGIQGGKTTIVAMEVVYRILESIINGREFKAWIVAPFFSLVSRTFERVWAILHDKNGLNFKGEKWILSGSSLKNLTIRLPNNSFVIGKTADNPLSLAGEDLDLIVIDESCLMKDFKDIWRRLHPRIAVRHGKILAITTPVGQDTFYDLWCHAKTMKRWESFHFPTSANPAFPKEMLDEIKATISAEDFAQDYNASVTIKSGRFFGEFSDKNLKKWNYDPNLETIMGIDFGLRRPHMIWAQIDKDDNIYIFDECAIPNMQVPALINIVNSKPYAVSARYVDPAGTSANSQTGLSDIMQFENAQIPLLYSFNPYDRDVKEGSKIIAGKICNCYKERSLFIDPDKCPVTVKSFFNIIVDKNTGKYKKDGINDHAIDTVRYMLVNRFPIETDEAFVGGYY